MSESEVAVKTKLDPEVIEEIRRRAREAVSLFLDRFRKGEE